MSDFEDPFPRPFRSFVARKLDEQRKDETARLIFLFSHCSVRRNLTWEL